jgi:hypothetical protein
MRDFVSLLRPRAEPVYLLEGDYSFMRKMNLPWDGDWRSRPGVDTPSSASTEKTGFWLNARNVLVGPHPVYTIGDLLCEKGRTGHRDYTPET